MCEGIFSGLYYCFLAALKFRQRNHETIRCNLVPVDFQGSEIMKFSVTIDDDLMPLLAKERDRIARSAGLREISSARAINAVLRRALTAGKAKPA